MVAGMDLQEIECGINYYYMTKPYWFEDVPQQTEHQERIDDVLKRIFSAVT